MSPKHNHSTMISRAFILLILGFASCVISGCALQQAVAEARKPKYLHFTFSVSVSVSDLYVPIFTPEENAAVLAGLTEGAKAMVTYYHTTSTFKMFTCLQGVTCFPYPHMSEKTTTAHRWVGVKIDPDRNTISINALQSLDKDYYIDELRIWLSPEIFSSQPSYRAIAENFKREDPDNTRTIHGPFFKYKIRSYSGFGLGPTPDGQECLDFRAVSGFPELIIPAAAIITVDDKKQKLFGGSQDSSPLRRVDTRDSPDTTLGRLAAARIASAQANINFDPPKV